MIESTDLLCSAVMIEMLLHQFYRLSFEDRSKKCNKNRKFAWTTKQFTKHSCFHSNWARNIWHICHFSYYLFNDMWHWQQPHTLCFFIFVVVLPDVVHTYERLLRSYSHKTINIHRIFLVVVSTKIVFWSVSASSFKCKIYAVRFNIIFMYITFAVLLKVR